MSGQSNNANDAETSIVKRSPFLPPDFEEPSNQKKDSRNSQSSRRNVSYEFRGVYQLGGEYRFLISERRKRNGDWLAMGQNESGVVVKNYDPNTQTLTFEQGGKTETVTLQQLTSDSSPMPVSGQPDIKKKDSDSSKSNRRIVRPSNSKDKENGNRRSPPPPPKWLKELRERRNNSGGSSGNNSEGNPNSGVNASGTPDFTPGPPPDFEPPPPPPDLPDDIPDPPSEPPPEPPPEIMEQIKKGRQ